METIFLDPFLFWRKIFILLYSITWQNFIVWLPLRREILCNMCDVKGFIERPTLRTFNNYIIIMTNNSDKIRILWVWCFSSVAYFWVNSAGCSGEFNVFKHFGNLENLILNILKLKKKNAYLLTCGLFVSENHVKLSE